MRRWFRSWRAERGRAKYLLRRGQRKFLLSLPLEHEDLAVYNGRLRVSPPLWGTRADTFSGRPAEVEAYLDFCYFAANNSIKFQGIGIPDENQRQGWASDMVKVLLEHYRGTWFFNSSVNNMSGPLFVKLQAEFPDRIAPLRRHEDGGYEILWNSRPGGRPSNTVTSEG